MNPPNPFKLGELVATPALMESVHPEDALQCLARHAAADWGDVCEEDRQANESALAEGLRLFSVYHDRAGVKFWIITEADRSSTCLILLSDY